MQTAKGLNFILRLNITFWSDVALGTCVKKPLNGLIPFALGLGRNRERAAWNKQWPSISVTIYVNHNCSCGILLNPKKIEQLPNQFGPGPYQKVLREVIQSCVDCAKHEKQVYNFIQDGSGKIVITGTCLSVFYIHLV